MKLPFFAPLRSLLVVLLIGASGFALGCDASDLQEEFRQDAEEPPRGITRTDDSGSLLLNSDGTPVEVDSTDWRTAPFYAGGVRFDPAYPNPTSENLITLPFVVPFSNTLRGGLILRGFSNTGRFVLLDEVPEAGRTGAWTFVFSPSALSASGDLTSIRGLHRLFVFDLQNELVSYGDILIE